MQIILTCGNVEAYLSLRMTELAFWLPFEPEDLMTAINLFNAQIDADESVYQYVCKQDDGFFQGCSMKQSRGTRNMAN